MDIIIIAVLSVTAVGAVCAAVLCIASKAMHVEVDERVAKIGEVLPGSNCGACGYPGCAGYAEALVANSDIKINLCTSGGGTVMDNLSEILGVEGGAAERKIAVVRCRGDIETRQKKMDYKGIETCAASKQLFGGDGACAIGCLGFGDCGTACPSSAVCLEDGLARINPSLCTGCGLCVKACPNKLITIESDAAKSIVLCSNIEKGAVARKKCSSACIACRRCARECPEQAIVVEDNLAVVEPEKCKSCGHCAEVCAPKCIKIASFS